MKLFSEDGVEKPSLEHQCHLYSCVCVAGIVVHKRPATIMRVSFTQVVGNLKGSYVCIHIYLYILIYLLFNIR